MRNIFNNRGRSVWEILIAVVILAVVLVGITVAVKGVKPTDTANDKEQTETKADLIKDQMIPLIKDADVDLLFDFEQNQLVIVSSTGFTNFSMNTSSIYIYSETFEQPQSLIDNEKVKIAMGKNAAYIGTVFCENVVTFLMEDNKADGTVELKVRVTVKA